MTTKVSTIALLLSFFTVFEAHAINLPRYLHFEGQLLDSNSQPITTVPTVVFQIYDPSGNCLLYEETQTTLAIDPANGSFSTKIGPDNLAGTPSANDGDVAWKTIFQNSTQIRTTGTNCSPGYTPAAGDERKLRVIVNGTALTPDFSLAPVPQATVAETLQGLAPSDFVLKTGNSNIDGDISILNENELRFGDSTANFVSLKAPTLVTATYSLTLPAADGAANQVLTTNGSGVLSWSTPSGGGIGTLNGLTANAQTFATDDAGTAPLFSSAGAIHTLSIPIASSAGVVAGLISNADYNVFNSVTTKLNLSGGTMTGTLNMNTQVLTGLPSPGDPTAAATKSYVDAAIGTTGDVLSVSAGPGLTGGGMSGDITLSLNTGTATGQVQTNDAVPNCPSDQKLNMSAGPTYSWQCEHVGKPASTNAGDAGRVKLFELAGSGTDTVTLRAPDAITTSYSLTLPPDAGAVNAILTSNGSGGLIWAIPGQMTNAVLAQDGTEGLPGISFLGDTNTGIHRPAVDKMQFVTNGAAAMTIDNAGNVGIGNDAPSALLTVGNGFYGADIARFDGPVLIGHNQSGSPVALTLTNFNGTNTGVAMEFVGRMGGTDKPLTRFVAEQPAASVGSFTIETYNAGYQPRLKIDQNGRVGVGTITPVATMDINGFMRLAKYNTEPVVCAMGMDGAIALTSLYKTCVCKGSVPLWVSTNDGSTACQWL